MVFLKSFRPIADSDIDSDFTNNQSNANLFHHQQPMIPTYEIDSLSDANMSIDRNENCCSENSAECKSGLENNNNTNINHHSQMRSDKEHGRYPEKQADDTREGSSIIITGPEEERSTLGISAPLSRDNDSTLTMKTNESLDASQSSMTIPSSISIVVVRHDSTRTPSLKTESNSTDGDFSHDDSASDDPSLVGCDGGQRVSSVVKMSESQGDNIINLPGSIEDNIFVTSGHADKMNEANRGYNKDNLLAFAPRNPHHDFARSDLSVNSESNHFEIVWSNLSYKIEPKWYKKFNLVDRMLSQFMPSQTVDEHSSATSTVSSSAGMDDNQHQMHNAGSNIGITRPKSAQDPIEIFNNLNGTIKSGQMTAVLGPSGAGKTTLLNCLTGKQRKGVSGHINIKGANGKHLKMCTIPQKDHLLELLTVEENLWFASKIKNPQRGFDHVKNIERVIDLLGLKRCRSAKIKKISGGQHKRVSIAQELLSNPDILVLDEPTSGLDSLTCYKTISMLRDLVELSATNDFMKPMAIIVTIHQPQPKVFNLFHHVYIIANGGRVIYEGAPELSLQTITGVTGLQPVESARGSGSSVDPASFLIEIASEEYGIEVIDTLSNYQRDVFYETLGARNERRAYQANYDANLSARDNHGFTDDAGNQFRAKNLKQLFDAQIPNSKESVNDKFRKNEISYNQQHIDQSTKQDNNNKQVKRRKKSAHSVDSGNSSNASVRSGVTSQTRNSSSSHDPNLYMSEQLLYTNVSNHKGRFWSHTATLTHRTLLTIRRDPLLMTSRVLFHLMIPILMAHVYGKATGAANACPHYEPEIDITQIPSLVENKRIEYMLEELHMSIENVSMFFIIMYAFAAAVLALNALSFPLNMQVLLKETRNGWYSMSSYVVAKTLADLPLELTMPCLTMALVYPLTGQPSSYLQWRMLTICLIMTLCSLIAQTQALILGALVMNSVQTAVFVSQASQLPWVILAGFTIRIKRLSEPLKLISLTSFYRLGCEAITLTRYGFGICPCDPQEITGQPVKLVGIPDQLRSVAQYWLDSVEASRTAINETDADMVEDSALTTTTTTLSPTAVSTPKTDIFQHLANQLSYANSYGVNITSCDDVAPDRIRAINLSDNWLVARIWHLFIMLIIMKILLYYAVKFSIGIRL